MIKTTINIPGHILEIQQNDDGSPCNFFKDGKKADVLTIDELKKIREEAEIKWSRGFDSGYNVGFRNCLHEIRQSIDVVEEQWKKDNKH